MPGPTGRNLHPLLSHPCTCHTIFHEIAPPFLVPLFFLAATQSPAITPPPTPSTTQPATAPAALEENLPIDGQNPRALKIQSYPHDSANPGLCAISPDPPAPTPPLPALYNSAIKGNIPQGSLELIAKLDDQYAPRKIIRFTRTNSSKK